LYRYFLKEIQTEGGLMNKHLLRQLAGPAFGAACGFAYFKWVTWCGTG